MYTLKDIDNMKDVEKVNSSRKEVKKTIKQYNKKLEKYQENIDLEELILKVSEAEKNIVIIDMDNFKENNLISVFQEVSKVSKNLISNNSSLIDKIKTTEKKFDTLMVDVMVLDEIKQTLTGHIENYAKTVTTINENKSSISKETRNTLKNQKEALTKERKSYLKEEKVIEDVFKELSTYMIDILTEFLGSKDELLSNNEKTTQKIEELRNKIDSLKLINKKLKKKEQKLNKL